MQRSLLMIVALLLPVATAACSESCAQSRYGKPPGTGTHVPTTGTGGLGGTQTQVPDLNGSLQGTRAPQLSSRVAGTGAAVATDTSTNVIVKDPPPPPEEPPHGHPPHTDENESENTTTCA